MDRTLNVLKAEKNIHGAILLLLCFTLMVALMQFFFIVVFPVLGLVQLLYAIAIQYRYKDSVRRKYVMTASIWIVLIILILLLGDFRINSLNMNKVVWLIIIFLVVPLILALWIWQIALHEYRPLKAEQDYNHYKAKGKYQ